MTTLDTHTPVRLSFADAVLLVFKTAARRWRACLVIVSVYALALGVTNAIARSSTGIVDPTKLGPSEVAAAGVEALAAIALFWAVIVFVGPITLGALSLVGSAAVYGDEIKTGGIVRRALDRALDAVATALVIGLFLVLPVVAVGFVSLVLVIAASMVGFVVLLFGTIFIALPLLYVFVRMSLAIPVVMREGRGPIGALRRSWALVRGAWWQVFAVSVVVSLVIVVLTWVVSVRSFAGYDTPDDFIIGVVATTLASAVSMILFGVASGVVYAMRAPEDTLPPDVVASEERANAFGPDDPPAPAAAVAPAPVERPPVDATPAVPPPAVPPPADTPVGEVPPVVPASAEQPEVAVPDASAAVPEEGITDEGALDRDEPAAGDGPGTS